ncbi:MAG TPA: hypothetical protein VM662_10415 [Sphingomonas sp.]|nr:hypothetical protein [Sphingomonas sp.]
MKLMHILAAAGALMTSAAAATPAAAQRYDGYRNYERYEYRDRDYRRDYRDRRYERRGYGWDRGRHNGWRNHQRCWTERRWGERVRVCRR